VSANNVDCHMTSNPSRMRYYVMLPHWMFVMFSWASHICGNAILSMSLDPSSVIITLGGHLYRIPEVVPTTSPPKQCLKVVSHTTKFIFSTICSKGEQRILQPLQPRPKHLLSTEAGRQGCSKAQRFLLHTVISCSQTG
jgi:hypothetical protein